MFLFVKVTYFLSFDKDSDFLQKCQVFEKSIFVFQNILQTIRFDRDIISLFLNLHYEMCIFIKNMHFALCKNETAC